MGLDMFLKRKTYVKNWNFTEEDERWEIKITRGGKPTNLINNSAICEIVEDAAYWRKANAIHKWFVDNVQDGNDDCGDYYVSEEKLSQLLATCKQLKESPGDGEELLPTQPGFFFGSTDYDEWYFQDLDYTIERLTELLAMDNSESSFYYTSSW